MSQEKVDRYKEKKYNRQKLMKREKLELCIRDSRNTGAESGGDL